MMTTVTGRQKQQQQQQQTAQEYVVPSSNSQEIQPSPLALLAATCSKIGSPGSATAASNEDAATGGPGASGVSNASSASTPTTTSTSTTVKVVSATGTQQQQLIAAADVSQLLQSQSFIQVPQTVQLADGTSAGTFKTLAPAPSVVSLPAGQILQQQPQFVTAQGQNITYNVIPQVQNITIDGQEAQQMLTL